MMNKPYNSGHEFCKGFYIVNEEGKAVYHGQPGFDELQDRMIVHRWQMFVDDVATLSVEERNNLVKEMEVKISYEQAKLEKLLVKMPKVSLGGVMAVIDSYKNKIAYITGL